MADTLFRQQPPGGEGKALTCTNCHAVNGVLNFRELGYSNREIKKLTNPEIYFMKPAKKQQEEW
jgi:hypothetical protein